MSTENEPQAGAVTENETVADETKEPVEVKAESEKTDGKAGKDDEKKHGRSSTKVKALEEELQKAGEQILELKDQLLRKQADFDNFRKRMFREKEEAIKYANSNLLQDIVLTIDDFERAIRSADESRDFDALHSGVELIEKQLSGMLERKYGLRRFESVGEEFDPEKHEALSLQESEEHDSQVVLEDYLKGFMLHDRVLRHAKVKVANPVAKKEDLRADPEGSDA